MRAVSLIVGVLMSWASLLVLGLQDARESGPVSPSDITNVEFQETFEVHEILLTIQTASGEPDSIRHQDERRRLLSRLEKNSGTWNTNHPRYRLLQALHGFRRYQERNMAELDRWRGLYKHVSKLQKKVLEDHVKYTEKFSAVEALMKVNSNLCHAIVDNALEFYGVEEAELDSFIEETEKSGAAAEKVSVAQALKHYIRDWAEEGANERYPGFSCVLSSISDLFPDQMASSAIPKVMIPGAGLGRLGHEVGRLGFEVTTNEWSMYMNVAYRFLESHRSRDSMSLYPFIDSWSHHATMADMLRQVSFPDVTINATSVVLIEGDFTTVLRDQLATYDIVLTYFFIDTARNLMSYLDTIHSLLKPGGYWINFGPLLYGSAPFVQLSLEEIIIVAESMGFVFMETPSTCGKLTISERHVRGKEAVYGFNNRALTKNAYDAQSWIAQKRHK